MVTNDKGIGRESNGVEIWCLVIQIYYFKLHSATLKCLEFRDH